MMESSENTTATPRRSIAQRLLSVRPSDLVILVFLCVLVGLVLAVFNVDPARLWVDFFGAVADAWSEFFHTLGSSVRWAIQYFFLGAVIVIPIWLAVHLIRAFTRR